LAKIKPGYFKRARRWRKHDNLSCSKVPGNLRKARARIPFIKDGRGEVWKKGRKNVPSRDREARRIAEGIGESQKDKLRIIFKKVRGIRKKDQKKTKCFIFFRAARRGPEFQ